MLNQFEKIFTVAMLFYSKSAMMEFITGKNGDVTVCLI